MTTPNGPEHAPEPHHADEQRYRSIGTRALHDTFGLFNYSELPEGFAYAAQDAIELPELAALMRSSDAEGFKDTTADDFEALIDHYQQNNIISIDIGVNHLASSKLVGFGNLQIWPSGLGELGDLIVHPDYRRRGIARAIVDQRLLQAKVLPAHKLYIRKPLPTNNLHNNSLGQSFYIERGFTELADGSLVLSPW